MRCRCFVQAIAELKKSGTLQINELHFYAADTLGRLERYPEAETEFIEELKYFPQNTRARGGLAMLYQASGQARGGGPHARRHAAHHADADSYALAARLYTMFGNRKQAEAVKAEARRAFAEGATIICDTRAQMSHRSGAPRDSRNARN